jgi:threonine/homoserine/homoserine lactone efflux protein
VLLTWKLAERLRESPKISMALQKAAGMFLVAFGIKLALSR